MRGSALRNLRTLDRWRRVDPHCGPGDEACGRFVIPSPVAGELLVIASGDLGWDHVSVSLANRTPTWAEMEFVKRKFFRPEAVCFQLHVAEASHISLHPHCLHIWRPWDLPVPLPPSWMVA